MRRPRIWFVLILVGTWSFSFAATKTSKPPHPRRQCCCCCCLKSSWSSPKRTWLYSSNHLELSEMDVSWFKPTCWQGMPTGSITSRHSFASKSQDSTVKSVQALISYGACSNMFTTNIAHGVRGYHSKCSDEIVIVGSLKFSSDPFGESRATWFVFSFFAVLCIVCFPLLSSMFDFFCGGSVVSAFVFLVDTMFVRSRWHFSFSRYSFLLRFGLYCWTSGSFATPKCE